MTTYNTTKDLDSGAVDFTTPVNTSLLYLAHVAVNFATAPEAAETITVDVVNAIGTLYAVNLLKYVSTAGELTTLTLLANTAIPVAPGSAVRVRVTNASQSVAESNDDPACYVTVTTDAVKRTGDGVTLVVNGVSVAIGGGSGGDALTTDPLSQFAPTTSAELAGVITNETGTGLLVFNTNAALVTPNLGTPSAVVLTNGTALPIGTGVSGLGAAVAAFLATPTLANFNTMLSDADIPPGGGMSLGRTIAVAQGVVRY
jgi:hypothetical protein